MSNMCETCDGRCCRHIALEIDTPTTAAQLDHIRWFLAHEGVQVFVDEGKWHLQVETVCRHLDNDNRCAIYENRMQICRDYLTNNCEATTNDFGYELHFLTDAEFDEYLANRQKKTKKKSKRKQGKRFR